MAKPNGYISKEMKREAIEYLFESGYIDDMTTDKRYYTTILLAEVANSMNIELVGLDLENGGTKDEYKEEAIYTAPTVQDNEPLELKEI